MAKNSKMNKAAMEMKAASKNAETSRMDTKDCTKNHASAASAAQSCKSACDQNTSR